MPGMDGMDEMEWNGMEWNGMDDLTRQYYVLSNKSINCCQPTLSFLVLTYAKTHIGISNSSTKRTQTEQFDGFSLNTKTSNNRSLLDHLTQHQQT